MEQLNHYTTKNETKLFPIAVVGEELRTPQNIGMCLRVSEAFGVHCFYLNENSPSTDNRIVQRTARTTEKTLNTQSYSDIIETLQKLKEEGYTIIALEITDKSKSIETYNFKQHAKIALLIGSERFGISPQALALCNISVYIPMNGKNSSMNVVNSLSVCLYEMTKQLKNNTTFI